MSLCCSPARVRHSVVHFTERLSKRQRLDQLSIDLDVLPLGRRKVKYLIPKHYVKCTPTELKSKTRKQISEEIDLCQEWLINFDRCETCCPHRTVHRMARVTTPSENALLDLHFTGFQCHRSRQKLLRRGHRPAKKNV
jgi:hypothetical protein